MFPVSLPIKKIITLSVLFWIFGFSVTTTWAQEAETSVAEDTATTSSLIGTSTEIISEELGSSTDAREELATPGRVLERAELRDELLTTRQKALEDFRQQRIINLGANISNRMDAVVERLFTITTRLEQRTNKLSIEGLVVTEASLSLQTAAKLLAEARQELSTIDATVYAAATSPEPYTAWQTTAKVQYQAAGEKIRAAYSALQTSITVLKSAPKAAETVPPVTEDPAPTPLENQ